jgi:tetratricopeptide (TPR) repeat protein
MDESKKTITNPYTAGRPVFGNRFFGREQIFQNIRDALVTSQQRLVVLHGQRRIGKSSILKELPTKLPSDHFVIVDFDLQYYAGQSLSKVLVALADAICRETDIELPDREVFEDNEFFFANDFLKEAKLRLTENQQLLVLIDEFDIIRETENERIPVASREFTTLLQQLINSEQKLSFILVAGSNLATLPGHLQSVFRLGTYVRVGFFDEAETKELIFKPAKDILTYSASALDTMFKLTSGHPYFTQLLCLEIFNHSILTHRSEIGLDEINTATKQSLVSGMGAFSWIWNELSLAERVYLSAVAHTVGKKGTKIVGNKEIQDTLEIYGIQLIGADLPNAAKDLVSRQFLEAVGPYQYCITVELIRRWVEKEHPLDGVKQDIENINPQARVKFEQARQAYSFGKLDRAIEYYQAAVRINPNHARAQIGLAQALFEKGDYEGSVTEFERANFLDEANARQGLVQALLAYGGQLEKNRDNKKALSIYNRVLQYASGNNHAKNRIDRLKPQNVLSRLISVFSRR